MARLQHWCSALFLVPMGLLTSHAARATGQVPAVTAAAGETGVALPKGVHLRPSGRYTRDLCDHGKSHYCLGKVLLPEGWAPGQAVPEVVREGYGGGSSATGMGPSDVVAAYHIPPSAAANGKIVAILDGPDSHAYSDLSAYRSQYGLPALPKCAGNPTGTSPCFAQVNEDGSASTGQDAGSGSDGETGLDMDMISAACPDCSILLVEIGGAQGNVQDSDFVTGAQTAARLGAVATSISMGGPEQGDPTGNNYTTPGHLVLAASGDFGYNLVNEGGGANTPSYPASAPDILAVGGTTLFSNGSAYDEAVWNDGTFSTGQNGQDITTSGCSTEFAALSWQASALAGTGCSKRATADLSAAAAFYSGGSLTDIAAYAQGWQQVEGTSASSPMIAGILVRLGLAEAISQNMGWVYTNAAAFNDLGSSAYPVDSSGSNTDAQNPSSCGKLCTAGPGWDGPSGVGTPDGTKLAALAGLPVTPTQPAADAGTGGTGTGTATGSGTGTAGSGTGTGTGATGGTGTGPTGTGGTGPSTPPASSAGALGAACNGPTDCASGLCARPNAAAAAVCTEPCTLSDAGSTCFIGFTCTYGYCWEASSTASTSSLPTSDPGAAGDSIPGAPSSSGCAVSSGESSGWGSLGWLAVGVVSLARRRRRAPAA